MKKVSLNLEPKTFFLLSGLVFVLGLGFLYLTYSNNVTQAQALEAQRKDIKDIKSVQADLDAGKTKINDLRSKLSHLENGVPPVAYVATLLHELEECGKKNNIEILGVQPEVIERKKDNGEEKKKSAYEEQKIRINGRGGYGDALRFVSALQQFPKIVAVRTVTINPKDTGKVVKGSPKLEIEISLLAFAFKDDMKTSAKTASLTSSSDETKEEGAKSES